VLLLVLDLAGVFVFALSGALLGVRKHLDVFGLAVLALSAGLGGGLVRDVVLDAAPPVALADARYLLAALAAAALAFVGAHRLERVGATVRVFDAAGLGLFAVAGTQRALDAGLAAAAAIVMGVITAIGGGVVRDILVREIPLVLRAEIYAVAALLGAVVVVLGTRAGVDERAVALAAVTLTFGVRMLSLRYGWHAPRALAPPD
jgi:uncharacterized membrane protein YeiH